VVDSLAGSLGTFETFTVDQKTYLYNHTGSTPGCTLLPAGKDQPASIVISASDLLAGIQNPRREKRNETVNGIKTDRYSFKQAEFPFGTPGSIRGKYWTAEAGHLVRLTADVEGRSSLFGATIDGKAALNYELTDINANFEISLPAECAAQQPPQDIPLPDGAENINSTSGLISFTTSLTANAVADFYRSSLPAAGWTAGEEKPVGKLLILNFAREGRSIAITISDNGPESTSVLISDSN
jgi:hypothetical protein